MVKSQFFLVKSHYIPWNQSVLSRPWGVGLIYGPMTTTFQRCESLEEQWYITFLSGGYYTVICTYMYTYYMYIYIYILILLLLLLLLLLLYVNSTKIGWIFDKHIEIAGWKNGSFFQDCCLQHGPRSWSYTVCRACHGRVLASFSQIARAEAQFSQSEGKHQWTRVGKMDRSFPRSHGHWKKASVPFRFPDGPQRKKTLADSLVEAGYGGAISNGVWALIFYGLNRKNKKLLCGGYCISMIYGGCKVP